jgi:hypothetical protein
MQGFQEECFLNRVESGDELMIESLDMELIWRLFAPHSLKGLKLNRALMIEHFEIFGEPLRNLYYYLAPLIFF